MPAETLQDDRVEQNLQDMTPELLRSWLVGLHNELVPDSNLTEFDANKNYMGMGMAGAMDGASIHFPRRKDKEELIDYALAKAKECLDPTSAATLLAASVISIHPFIDGNGRVSRAVYTDLSGQERVEEGDERTLAGGVDSRRVIDLGTSFTLDGLLSSLSNQYVYIKSGVKQSGLRVRIHKLDVEDDLKAVTLSSTSVEGLDLEEKGDLIEAIGADAYGNTYRCDLEALMFAARSAVQKQPDLESLVGDTSDGAKIVGLHDLLSELSTEGRKEFVASIWQYRKLRAQSVIDFLSDDYGSTKVAMDNGATTLHDLVIERTNNLESSTVKK